MQRTVLGLSFFHCFEIFMGAMQLFFIAVVGALTMGQLVWAQDRIYRCGDIYTNVIAKDAVNCKLITGANVTIVQPSPPKTTPQPSVSKGSSQPGLQVSPSDQRTKDADARIILEAELKKAEALYGALSKEFNAGEPEKLGPEHKNHQKYLDRIAELKASLARVDADRVAIRRELSRFALQ